MQDDRHQQPSQRRSNSSQERTQLGIEAPGSDHLRAQDHWRVDLGEAWEISFWSREFGCTEAELRKAVEAVGSNAGTVRGYLASQIQQQRS